MGITWDIRHKSKGSKRAIVYDVSCTKSGLYFSRDFRSTHLNIPQRVLLGKDEDTNVYLLFNDVEGYKLTTTTVGYVCSVYRDVGGCAPPHEVGLVHGLYKLEAVASESKARQLVFKFVPAVKGGVER